MDPRPPSSAARREEDFWFDGHLWWPSTSADGKQRWDGGRWVPLRARWRWVKRLGIAMSVAYPIGMLPAFAYIASEPAYVGQPEPPHAFAVGMTMNAWLPATLLLLVAGRIALGRPGLVARRSSWIWSPPPDWPEPPPGWQPTLGWQPDPRWPAPPEQWRGWTLERPPARVGAAGT